MARKRYAAILGVSLALTAVASQAALPSLAPLNQLNQPKWAELSAGQKEILAPLASEWDSLDAFRRKKWLGIAQRYTTLSPDEQYRIQQRMIDWAKLTPEERKLAREKFIAIQKSPPQSKDVVKQKWQEYTELPESERARLQEEAKLKALKATKQPLPKPAAAPSPAANVPPGGIPAPPPAATPTATAPPVSTAPPAAATPPAATPATAPPPLAPAPPTP